MALAIRHKFVSAIPDGGDLTIVQPSNWNDDHSLSGSLAMSFVDGLTAALADKVGSASLSAQVAALDFVTSNSVSIMIAASPGGGLTSNSASVMIATQLGPYITSNSASVMIAAALGPYSTSNSISVAIASAIAPLVTSNSLSAALALQNISLLGCIIDGGGAAIAAGIKGDLGPFPFKALIQDVTLLADQSGSIVIDIWRDSYANFPPTVADTFVAAAKPTIASALKSQDATLTGWSVTISAGETLRFNVDSCSAIARCSVAMKVLRA